MAPLDLNAAANTPQINLNINLRDNIQLPEQYTPLNDK